MVKEGPRQDELVQLVIAIRNAYNETMQHNPFWMNALMMQALYDLDITDPKNQNDILDYVTPGDIQEFARRLFENANLMDISFVTRAKWDRLLVECVLGRDFLAPSFLFKTDTVLPLSF